MIPLKAGMRAIDNTGRTWIVSPRTFTAQKDVMGDFFLVSGAGWNEVSIPWPESGAIMELYDAPRYAKDAITLEEKYFGPLLWSREEEATKLEKVRAEISELKEKIANLEKELG